MNQGGETFWILDSIDSTNNYAMARAQARLASHGEVVFAREQTAGRGQRGRRWLTEPGQNIMMSIIVKPHPWPVSEAFAFSAAVALGAWDFLESLAGDETRIKWPNDLYWRDRKAGGILIENLLSGNQWEYAIVGIGININQVRFDPALQKAVSLKQITGRDWNPVELARDLSRSVLFRLNQLREEFSEYAASGEEPINRHASGDYTGNESASGEGRWVPWPEANWRSLQQEYEKTLYRRGEETRLRHQDREFTATILGVDRRGYLRTRINEEEKRWNLGEIEWLG